MTRHYCKKRKKLKRPLKVLTGRNIVPLFWDNITKNLKARKQPLSRGKAPWNKKRKHLVIGGGRTGLQSVTTYYQR